MVTVTAKEENGEFCVTVGPMTRTVDILTYTLCPRKNCTPRQCTVELSSPNAS